MEHIGGLESGKKRGLDRAPSEEETIKAAATIYKGKMYTGIVHPLIFADIEAEHPDMQARDCTEGFVTTKGRFLSRQEAKIMADQQDLTRPGRDKYVDKELWTEYLPYNFLKPDDKQ